MRVLITGSRDWNDWSAVRNAYDWVNEQITNDQSGLPSRMEAGGVTVVSGHCPSGADFVCERLAFDYGFRVEHHAAQWKVHGKQAGFIRNGEMVDLGADICFAFQNPCRNEGCATRLPHFSHGVIDCADKAEAAHIPTFRWKHMGPGRDYIPVLPGDLKARPTGERNFK